MSASPPATLPRRTALAVTVLVSTAGWAACSSPEAPPDPPAAPVTATSTPLASYDTEGLVLARRDPCAALSAESVAEVLGGEPTSRRTWMPGERVPGTPEVGDEWGCGLTRGDVTARAWVFAPAVPRPEARRLAKDPAGTGCQRLERESGFGRPGSAYACEVQDGRRTGFAGLVRDAWVVCEVAQGDSEAADRWCVAVLESLSAS